MSQPDDGDRLSWEHLSHLLGAALDGIPEGVRIIDLDGRPIFVNTAFGHTALASADVAPGAACDRAVDGGAACRQASALTCTEWSQRVRPGATCAQGATTTWFEGLMCNADGAPCARIQVIAGSTESGRSEEAIRDSEQRYRVILHSMSDAVFIVNHHGIIETINDAAAAQGYVAAGGLSVGVHLRAVLPPATAERRLEVMRAVLKSREPAVIEEEISSRGLTVYLSTTVNPLASADGSCNKVVMVSRDVTAGREREVFLRRFSKSILSAQEAERRRVAGEMHDGLAQSLAALRVALRQMARDTPPGDSARRERVGEAIDSVGALIEDVRRIAHNLTPTILEDLGLTAAIERLVRTFSTSGELVAEGHVIALDGVFLPEEEIHIYRVVQEVLSNIHRHARARHMVLTVRRVVNAIEFEVQDDGVGFRADQPLSTAAHDSVHQGLHGLQERARLLNGTLSIRSTPGEGTTIVLTIPVVIPPAAVRSGRSA